MAHIKRNSALAGSAQGSLGVKYTIGLFDGRQSRWGSYYWWHLPINKAFWRFQWASLRSNFVWESSAPVLTGRGRRRPCPKLTVACQSPLPVPVERDVASPPHVYIGDRHVDHRDVGPWYTRFFKNEGESAQMHFHKRIIAQDLRPESRLPSAEAPLCGFSTLRIFVEFLGRSSRLE